MAVYIEERWSAAAWWCRRCAAFAVLLAFVAIAAHRFGYLDTSPFLVVLAVVAGLAVLALVFAINGFQRVWYEGDRGGGQLATGVIVALLALAPYAFAGWLALEYPPLNQATTDLEDPPVVIRQGAGYAPVPPLDLTEIVMHQQAYPDLTGRRYSAPVDQVMVAVEGLMQSRGWTFVQPDASGDTVEFVLNSVARLPVLAIPYDVSIRLTDEGNATYVDMRAAARYGDRDLGVDAWLIDDFLTELDTQAGTLSGLAPPAEQ